MKTHNSLPTSLDAKGGTKVRYISVVILFVVAIGGTYIWQHNQVDKLNQQINDLEKRLAAAKTNNPQTASPSPTAPAQTTYTSLNSVSVNVTSPQGDEKVKSPLAIAGEVPGNWSFEASFPIILLNSDGEVVAKTTGQVLGDWMTDSLVPFSAKLTWVTPETGNGTLVLQKDNPSGDPANDDSVSIPVKF